MRNPVLWLFLVPWLGGSIAASLPMSAFGLWGGVVVIIVVVILARWMFDTLLHKYWMRRP
jgi:hypothetical protein